MKNDRRVQLEQYEQRLYELGADKLLWLYQSYLCEGDVEEFMVNELLSVLEDEWDGDESGAGLQDDIDAAHKECMAQFTDGDGETNYSPPHIGSAGCR